MPNDEAGTVDAADPEPTADASSQNATQQAVEQSSYPPPVELGSGSDDPDPINFAKDWRLLAPEGSKAFQEAQEKPKKIDAKDSQQILQIFFANLSNRE